MRKVVAGESLDDQDSIVYDEELFVEGYEGYSAEVDGYLMKTNKMGYINCDRFMDEPIKTDLIVKCKQGSATEKNKMCYRLVFSDIKSIMSGYEYSPDGKMKFANLPKGREAIVLAFQIPKNGTPKFAFQKVKLGKDYQVELTPVDISLNDLKAQLSGLF